jgi:hypothetical protein
MPLASRQPTTPNAMRMAAMTPTTGSPDKERSRMIPMGSDHSMAQAVVRHGRNQRATGPVPAAQATAKGRTSSGIVHFRSAWDTPEKKAKTGKTQVATAKAARRPGRFCATSTTALNKA